MDLSVGQKASIWDKSSADLTEQEAQYMAVWEPVIPGSNQISVREVVTMSDETTSVSTDAGTTSSADAGSTTQTETAPATYTQEQLDKIVTERVNKSKAQFKDYADLKAQAASLPTLQSQVQTLTTEKAELESNFNLAVKDAVTLKVAIDKQVPLDLVDRLKGNTPEEIAADADKLMSQVGPSKPAFTGFNGGVSPGGTPHSGTSADDALRQAFGYGQ